MFTNVFRAVLWFCNELSLFGFGKPLMGAQKDLMCSICRIHFFGCNKFRWEQRTQFWPQLFPELAYFG